MENFLRKNLSVFMLSFIFALNVLGGVSRADEYNLYVGGTGISTATDYTSGDTVQYVKSSNTLKLNGYTYTGAGYNDAAIYYNETNKPLIIELSGTNTIKQSGNSNGSSYGIYVASNALSLTISGDGSLDVSAGEAKNNNNSSYGIYGYKDVYVTGNTYVKATGGKSTGYNSYGIYAAGGNVSFDGNAKVEASGGEAKQSYGIYGYKDVYVTGNTYVKATGGKSTGYDSYGIYAAGGNVSFDVNAKVEAKGGEAKDGTYGIRARKIISITGSADVKAEGGKATDGFSYGIYADIGNVSFDVNAKVEASGGEATNSSYGIYAVAGNVYVTGSADVKGGTATNGNSYGIYTYSQDVYITGSADVKGGTATNGNSYGIYAKQGNVSFDVNANVEANGGEAGTDSFGIYAKQNISVTDSADVKANGGKAQTSTGIACSGSAFFNGDAKVTAVGGEATYNDSTGLSATDSVSIDGNATVTATGGNATQASKGLFFSKNMSIDGNATLTANGGTGEMGSMGIFTSNGTVTIGDKVRSVTVSGDTSAFSNTVKNSVRGMGWDNADGSGERKLIPIDTGGQTLSYKKVEFPYCTVSFDSNGGSSVNSEDVRGGYKVTKPTDPARTGYDFGQWYKESSFTNAWDFGNDTVTADTTLYARWIPVTYSISYELNGGTVATANEISYDITSPDITLNKPTKTGYTFAGWTGTGITGTSTDVTIPKGSFGDRTYTATWTANTYSVKFDANNGNGTMTGQGFTYDVEQALNANSFSRTGYTFAGWNTQADGKGTDYDDGQKVKNLTAENGGTVTLYAKWNVITYTISYTLNNGTVATANPTSYTVETETFKLNNPTKNCYTFDGWTGTGLTAKTQPVTIAKGSTGDKTFTANFSPISYAISYELNGGTVATANPTSYTIESNAITLNNPTKNGYNFDGWTGTGLTAKTQPVTIAKGSTGDKTFTANFSPVSYAISYELNGGTVATANPTSYTIESNAITLNNPTKNGYNFKGWTPEGVISSGSTGEKTFTANWNLITYSISYDLDGGEVATANPTSYTIESADIKLNNPTKTSYDFTGWTGSNGTTPQTSVTIASGSTGDKNFKANFVIISLPDDDDKESDDVKPDDTKSKDIKPTTSDDKKVEEAVKEIEEIFNTVSGDESQTLTQEQVNEVIKKLESVSNDVTLNSKEAETLVKSILSNDSKLSGEQIKTVAKAIVSDDGKIDDSAMKTLTDSIQEEKEKKGENAELKAEDLTGDSTAAKIAVQALTSSVNNSGEKKELNLESVALESCEGMSELIKEVAKQSDTETSELTLNLSNNNNLDKVDNLEGVSLKEIKLEGNTSVTEVKLDGATVQSVDLKGSRVQEISLNAGSDVKEIDASGATELTSLDLASNDKIQTLDISKTGVSELNASGCANLENLTAEGGSEEGSGKLESINLEGCNSIKNINIVNNRVLGVKKPSGFTMPTDFEFKARGQKRTTDTKFSMNFFELINGLLKAALSTADNDNTTNNDLPFDIGYIVSVKVDGNEASVDNDGNLSMTPSKSLSYELDPFGLLQNKNVEGGSINTADDENSDEGMDVTIENSSENENGDGANGSGGGCDLVRSEELGGSPAGRVRSVLVLALFLLGLMELALIKKSEIKKS